MTSSLLTVPLRNSLTSLGFQKMPGSPTHRAAPHPTHQGPLTASPSPGLMRTRLQTRSPRCHPAPGAQQITGCTRAENFNTCILAKIPTSLISLSAIRQPSTHEETSNKLKSEEAPLSHWSWPFCAPATRGPSESPPPPRAQPCAHSLAVSQL